MLDESAALQALEAAKRSGAEYYEAYLEQSYSKGFAIEQGKVNATATGQETGLRIRLIKKRRLYTLSTDKTDKRSVSELIARFRHFPGIGTGMSAERKEKASYSVAEKESVDDANMLKDLGSIDKELAKQRHIKFRSVYGNLGRSVSYYANSDGSEIHANLPSIGAFIPITVGIGAETKQSMTQIGATGGYEQFDAGLVADRLLETAKSLSKVIERGKTLNADALRSVRKAVIAPEITGIAAHESVGHPNEADRVFGREAAQAGTSYVTKDNLGLRIGSSQVTIMDDPTIENSNGFYLYDDEGVKSRARVIVEKGMQKELLLNREYASMLRRKSNGAARSDSYTHEPMVRMANTYLKPGRASLDELISEAKEGVYVKSFNSTEWNIDDTRSFARYSGNEAYMIRNGSLAEPVKNYKIEMQTLDFWRSVKLVGKDTELYTGTCGKGEPMQGVPVTMGGAAALLEFG